LSNGDANYTLVQVAMNDLILLLAFVPLVQLLSGINGIGIPYDVLISSVVIFVVIPLLAGYLSNRLLINRYGASWFKERFLTFFKPISIIALLSTLVLLFAYQGQQILNNPLHILLIAIPLSIQTYVTFFIGWKGARLLKLPHNIAAPAAMIGASNFFELAVAVAIMVFGPNSGAALATVVGVLIEVPIMLSLVFMAKRWRY
jgi:ACR3 family arsenite transporter